MKRNLVAQLLLRQGGFWEAIKNVRSRWQLDPVPTQLPPESEDILHSPWQTAPAQQPLSFSAVILPLDRQITFVVSSGNQALHTDWLNPSKGWESELCGLLLCAVPKRCLGAKFPPYAGGPSSRQRLLPWLRFASACVLYDPPPENAPAFADYGGLPLFPSEETGGGHLPGVLTERELREGEAVLTVQNTVNNEAYEKAWKLRSRLGEPDF
jgi:hypothetical protein